MNPSIKAFWDWVSAHVDVLDQLEQPDQDIWDEVLRVLKEVDHGLWFEVSDSEHGVREFVVTAEGRTDLFPLVDQLVAHAPQVRGWSFVPLKPPMGFDFSIDYEGVQLDPRELRFLPLKRDTDESSIGIRIGVPEYLESKRRATENAVMIALDTALGERSAAVDLEYVEVGPLPTGRGSSGYRPLTDLPAFIAQAKRRRPLH